MSWIRWRYAYPDRGSARIAGGTQWYRIRGLLAGKGSAMPRENALPAGSCPRRRRAIGRARGEAAGGHQRKMAGRKRREGRRVRRGTAGEFFDGNTVYNFLRRTDRGRGRGPLASHVLVDDAGRFARLLAGATTSGIGWPGYASQFESCELRAVMCCWTQDR